eukprot:2484129-Ditylum_brightwellii.AAC.1
MVKPHTCQAFNLSADHNDEDFVETVAFLVLYRDLKNFEALWWISRIAGSANVASFILVEERGSPCLGKLVEVLAGVAQGTPGGHTAANIECSSCREWAGGQVKPSVLLAQRRFLPSSLNCSSPGPAVLDGSGAVSCDLDLLDEPH